MDRKPLRQPGIQERHRSRLANIVSEGLDPLPDCIFDLDVLLCAPVVDLKKVTKALSSDIGLSRRILRLSNVGLIDANDSPQDISDAVVVLGPCLFHAAVLLCAVTDFGPCEFRDRNAEALWSHSVLTATVAERIAELSDYPVRGMAYVAGLLHDIGHLPMLIAAREAARSSESPLPSHWRDDIELERDYFGMDHCELGRWMGMSWKFSPPLMNAVEHHHDPAWAKEDSHLAEILGAAEHFCSGAFAPANKVSIAESLAEGETTHQGNDRVKRGFNHPIVWGLRVHSENHGERFHN